MKKNAYNNALHFMSIKIKFAYYVHNLNFIILINQQVFVLKRHKFNIRFHKLIILNYFHFHFQKIETK